MNNFILLKIMCFFVICLLFNCGQTPTEHIDIPPDIPNLISVTAGNSTSIVIWNNVSNTLSYNIYYLDDTGVTNKNGLKILKAVSPYTLSNLKNGQIYSFCISAINDGGESECSNVITCIPISQIISQMILIPGGTFIMGDTFHYTLNGVIIYPNLQHKVNLSNFYMENTLVTQASYKSIMNINPSFFTGDDNRPVEMITWSDAILYCNARSKKEGRDTIYTYTEILGTPGNGCTHLKTLKADLNKNGYRLPTEAEFQYACRAGTVSDCYWGGLFDSTRFEYEWFYANSKSTTHSVGQKKANAWGLFDMCGNVSEMSHDSYTKLTADSVFNPSFFLDFDDPSASDIKVVSGGSYNNQTSSSCSGGMYCQSKYKDIGFRCVYR